MHIKVPKAEHTGNSVCRMPCFRSFQKYVCIKNGLKIWFTSSQCTVLHCGAMLAWLKSDYMLLPILILAKCKRVWKRSIVNPFPTPENWGGQWGHSMQICLHMVSWLATPVFWCRKCIYNWAFPDLFAFCQYMCNIGKSIWSDFSQAKW